MGEQGSDEEEKGLGLPGWIKWATLMLAILAIGVYVYGIRLSSTADVGTLGDFVGGTLNPVFAFISFLALLYTINIQLKELALSRQELRLTREELSKSADALQSQNETSKRQRFENTLFSMIGVLNQIVVDMDLIGGANPISGRDCFRQFFQNLESRYDYEVNRIARSNNSNDEQGGNFISIHKRENIKSAYNDFYIARRGDLGHYFRVIFNIFRYIDQNEIEEDVYQKIFRAQFSDPELLIIFYNTICPRGQPLVQYAKKFALFDNLNTESLFRKEHMNLIDPKAFGANPRLPPKEKVGHNWSDD
jgi:Putative phage abortive infection protein